MNGNGDFPASQITFGKDDNNWGTSAVRIPADALSPYMHATDRVSYVHYANGKLFPEQLADGRMKPSLAELSRQNVVTVSLSGIERISLKEPFMYTLTNPQVRMIDFRRASVLISQSSNTVCIFECSGCLSLATVVVVCLRFSPERNQCVHIGTSQVGRININFF